MSLTVAAQEESCDGSCGGTSITEQNYQVVSPVGRQSVEMITMAPRLDTFEGKTIALVGGSFMASVTHVELRRIIQDLYPTTRVFLLDEIGSAGLYPAPGVRRRSVEEFQQKLKEWKVDAVISGNGGCGICTPKETGSCIAAEYLGIPSVMIAAPGFDEQAVVTALNNGVPALRVAVYPGAFATHTTEQLKDNTREVLWPQIQQALTTPISTEELEANKQLDAGDLRAVIYNATISDVNDFFQEMSWSDGLPIIPPTVERVNEFLRFTDYSWDTEVAILSPSYRKTLVWHVAVNGVMAGCKPEYMPLLIALTKAMGDPSYRRTLGSTHAWIPYCWLNGPVARQLGFDYGQGQINERANIAIGRFLNLALMNLSGLYVKQDRMGTFGYPVSWCLTEDETACVRVGWQPYHVRKGFSMNDNTVTVSSALLWGNNMAPATTDGEKIMQLLAWDITERSQLALGSGMQYTYRTIMMTEPVAVRLKEIYATPEALETALVETARRPLYERAFAHYYANPGSALDGSRVTFNQYLHLLEKQEDAVITTTPQWYAAEQTEMLTIPTMQIGETAFLITGDASRNKIQTMPGGGTGTVAVVLPHNWDDLMEEKGYPPLSSLYLGMPSDDSHESSVKDSITKTPVRTSYYDMSGKRVATPRKGIYIKRFYYGNGSSSAEKRLY
ncbi:MAG: hypothetical protein J6Z18_09645 [Prevotella sp.]|nr:hypothetical protein [Prevotella sp.]